MRSASDWMPVLNGHDGARPALSKRAALAQAIIEAIKSGELPDGGRLPPVREMAHYLAISAQTVNASYREVQRLGLIRSSVGSGSFVTARKSDRSERDGTFISSQALTPEGDLSVMLPIYTAAHEQAIAATFATLSHGDNRKWMYPSRPVIGQLRHREVAASWLTALDIDTSPEQVFITNGATHGIFLAMAAVARPGDVVLTEKLTENGIIGAANMLGLNLVGVDSDEEGVLPSALDEACQQHSVAALVWVPTFGNPTVHLAGTKRREAIAEVARRRGIAVIEDEIHKPLLAGSYPSIISLLPEKGFFVTGMSKSVMSGLRVGYLVAPFSFLLRISGMIRASTWNVAPVLPELATRLISDGTVDALISVQRSELQARHDVLQFKLGDHIARSHPSSLSAWLNVPPGWNERDMVMALQEQGILSLSSVPFQVGGHPASQGIRICISSPDAIEDLEASLDKIRNTFDQVPTFRNMDI